MNEEQYKEFACIVEECKVYDFRTGNAASKWRSDTIVAAWEERGELRELLREAVILFECDDECSDPATDAWGWLQNTRTVLEGVCWND